MVRGEPLGPPFSVPDLWDRFRQLLSDHAWFCAAEGRSLEELRHLAVLHSFSRMEGAGVTFPWTAPRRATAGQRFAAAFPPDLAASPTKLCSDARRWHYSVLHNWLFLATTECKLGHALVSDALADTPGLFVGNVDVREHPQMLLRLRVGSAVAAGKGCKASIRLVGPCTIRGLRKGKGMAVAPGTPRITFWKKSLSK